MNLMVQMRKKTSSNEKLQLIVQINSNKYLSNEQKNISNK